MYILNLVADGAKKPMQLVLNAHDDALSKFKELFLVKNKESHTISTVSLTFLDQEGEHKIGMWRRASDVFSQCGLDANLDSFIGFDMGDNSDIFVDFDSILGEDRKEIQLETSNIEILSFFDSFF